MVYYDGTYGVIPLNSTGPLNVTLNDSYMLNGQDLRIINKIICYPSILVILLKQKSPSYI